MTMTTGEAAKLAGLSAQTINRLVDSGELEGVAFRIPGSQHRRVHREGFLAWLEARGIPVSGKIEKDRSDTEVDFHAPPERCAV